HVINPATEESLEEIEYGGEAQALEAVTAAHDAFGEWSAKTVYERAGLLQTLALAIRKNQDELARLLTLEVGKPLPESKGEVNGAADQYEWYAEEVKRSAGDVIPQRMADKRHLTIRHPVGPVAAISPWNFPLLLSARKMAPALAAGCTVVNRPASQAPLAQARIFELMDQVGFPKGVVNLVVGDAGACSRVFVGDPRIKKISFTGSLEVGRELYQACAREMKKISLELGGHSPFVVLPDIPPEEAAQAAAFAKYRNMGQVCISPSRFLVPNEIKAEFEAAVVERVSQLKIGNGLDPFVEVGPLFESRRLEATQAFVADIQERGGKILWGGCRPDGMDRGYFYTPTVATNLDPESKSLIEEPFAPVMPIQGYDTV
ncbi:MAG: aldehyde dehydrogenase family protein, partial [Desulfobacterales bacterium]|nr:aldehyde dehydrogenase family protein [Desulfobacterales bacterium]